MKRSLFYFALITVFLFNVWGLSFNKAEAQSGIYVRPNSSSLTSPVTNGTWFFNSTNGKLYVYNGSTFLQSTPPFSNLTATTNPSTSNDNTQGYQIGSVWVNTSTEAVYMCLNTTTSAAVWVLIANTTSNAGLIPLMLETQFSTGDIASAAVLPAVPGGSTLTISLPQGYAYVNGNLVQTPATANHTFTATKYTYVFINTDGTLNFQVQNVMTTPPVIANTLLAYLVVTNGSTVTAVTPYYALPATLRNYMIVPPNSTGQVFQTDTTQPLGTKFGYLPITSLDATGTTAYTTIFSNGTNWIVGFLPLAGLDTSAAVDGNTLQLVAGAWAAQTLDPTGGGTGTATPPTDGQIPIGSTSGSAYTPANITTTSPNVTITNGSGTIAISTAGFAVSTKSSSFSAAASSAYFVTATALVTLPDATTCSGDEIVIWNTGSGTLTFATASSQTINGAAAGGFSRNTQWQMMRFLSDGTNWEMFQATGPTS